MSGHTGYTSMLTDPSDPHAEQGALRGHVKPSDPQANDSVEGKPGIIERAELAPLGEEKVADDREYLQPVR